MKRMLMVLTVSLLFMAPVLLLPESSIGRDAAVPPGEAEKVLATAFAMGAEFYAKYRGIESLRKEILREYDPVSGALRSTSEVTTRRREYYYEMPEIEVLSYTKDGTAMEPSKFRVWKAMPVHPIFDARAREHYRLSITDRKKIGGRLCYRVQVDPKQNTSRHFRGSVYITAKTFEMVAIEGTMAKLDFPLKEFHLEMNLSLEGSLPVAKNGLVRLRVYVPIFYPDTKIESAFEVLESRPIQ